MRPFRHKAPRYIAPVAALATTFYLYQNWAKKTPGDTFKVGCAGALTQCVSEVVLHCIDTVNVRCKGGKGRIRSYSVIQNLLKEYGAKGLLKLFVGINATFYASAIGGIVYFTLYKKAKIFIKKIWKSDDNDKNAFRSFMRYFLAAIISEVAALVVYFPFEVMKTRLQTSNDRYKYKSLPDAFKKILHSSGERGPKSLMSLYSGCGPFFAMFTLYTAIQFTCYEEMMRILKIDESSLEPEWNIKMPKVLLASVISGAVASLSTNWLEVFTVKKQIDPTVSLRRIWKEEGSAIFTKGIFPRTLFNISQSALVFTCLGMWCKYYNIKFEG